MVRLATKPAPAKGQINFDDVLEQEAIRTFFQPIVAFNRPEPETYGVEALTRGPAGSSLESALDLFNTAEREGRLYDLEKIARRKAMKRLIKRFADETLFLNLDPNVIYDSSFRSGTTIEYMQDCGLDQNRIVFEITERNQIQDQQAFEDAIRHYRDQGFRVAVDDVGSGYSNMDTIARLQPDFIKIDMALVRELHLNRPRFQLVETIIDFSERIGAEVIAEGIEVKEELQTLLSMGIEYGQGHLLARPAPDPDPTGKKIYEIHQRCLDTSHAKNERPSIGKLARPSKTFSPETLTKKAYRYLEEHSEERSLVILENEKPVGLLMRDHLYQKLSTNVGQSLYWDRSVINVMDESPLVLPADTSLSKASEMVIERTSDDLYDEVIVVDPETKHYRGNVSVRQLLEKITQLKTRKARRANPLTGLPGNVEIQERIQRNLDAEKTFALIYADLDHFKPFNDYYGFERGDQAILLLKNVLEDGLQVHPAPENFLGHVGGDDFVVMTAPDHVEDFCEYVIKQFDDRITELYDEQDLNEGVIRTEGRNGENQEFDLMTVSLAVVDNVERDFESHLRMSEVAAEMKKYTKRNRQESSYEIDRRTSNPQPVAE